MYIHLESDYKCTVNLFDVMYRIIMKRNAMQLSKYKCEVL